MSTFTVTVPADAGAGSLRQAITSANAVPNSTINFSAGFTINLASALPTITQPIAITGNSNTISGGGITYCLYVQLAAQASVSISNLTFSQGYTTNGTAGLQVTNANLTLVDVNVSGCVVDYDAQTTFGVGMTLTDCITTMSGSAVNASVIEDNSANLLVAIASDVYVGIGMRVNGGQFTMINVSVLGNSFVSANTFGVLSGGLHLDTIGTIAISNSRITNNDATANAGLYVTNSAISLIDTSITLNTSLTSGGGIGAVTSVVTLGSTIDNLMTISNNICDILGAGLYLSTGSTLQTSVGTSAILVQGNSITDVSLATRYGVGICSDASTVNIENVTMNANVLQGNTANGNGIAMITSGDHTLTNCRITNSVGNRGIGIYALATVTSLTLVDCLIDNNTPKSGAPPSTGGGIDCRCPLFYSGLTITNNSNTNGGGLHSLSSVQPLPAALPSVVSGNSATEGGGIYNSSSVPSVFDNITIQNNTTTIQGGGILLAGSGTKTVSNCLVDSNSQQGITAASSTSIIIDTVISNNTSVFMGGGVTATRNCTITNTTLTETIFNNTAASNGGGVFSYNALTMSNVIMRNNTAQDGGNIYQNNDTSSITNCIINNGVTTGGFAGGITILDGVMDIAYTAIPNNQNIAISVIGGTININNCNIINSTTGIFNADTIAVLNSTIGNHTNGIINNSANLTLTNATIARNSNVGVNNLGTTGIINVVNTIIALNTVSDVLGSFISQGYNLIQNTTGSTGFTQPTDITGVDPQLAPYSNNGGPTATMALLPTSPALGAGNTTAAVGTFDQRGPGFLRVVNENIDIGAFESQAIVCFKADSLILVKCKITNAIKQVRADRVSSNQYLIYEHISKTWQPIIHNIVTYNCKRFIKLGKGIVSANVPTCDTYITSGHPVWINGQFIKARLIQGARTVYLKYQNIHSICLRDSNGAVMVNGLPAKAFGHEEWKAYSEQMHIRWHDHVC